MYVSTSYRPLSSKARLKVFVTSGSSSTIRTLFLASVSDDVDAVDDNLCPLTLIIDSLKAYGVNHI